MRKIKFRGRAISDLFGVSVDKIVHGDLFHEWNKVSIFDEDDGDIYKVDPESIAQFVGHDSNGNEVYEGDTLIDLQDGAEWLAVLRSEALYKPDNGYHRSNLDKLTLKEAAA